MSYTAGDTVESSEACVLCGGTDFRYLVRGYDRLSPRMLDVDYIRCVGCSLVVQWPMPDVETIATFYPDDYVSHETPDPEKEVRREGKGVNAFLIKHLYHAKAARSGLMRGVAKLLAPFALKGTLEPRGECRLLDVGCGSGAFLYRHHRLGWQVTGVEPSDVGLAKARDLGMTVHQGFIDDVPKDGRYDVITFRHVLEHVQDPIRDLKLASELLAPGGCIIVLVPNIDAYGFERFGEMWYPLEAPRHLYQYAPATLRRIGQQAGLKVVAVETEMQQRMILQSEHFVRSIGYDFGEVTELAKRERILTDCKESEEVFLRANKLRRKLMWLPTWWRAKQGHGETMKGIFERK